MELLSIFEAALTAFTYLLPWDFGESCRSFWIILVLLVLLGLFRVNWGCELVCWGLDEWKFKLSY